MNRWLPEGHGVHVRLGDALRVLAVVQVVQDADKQDADRAGQHDRIIVDVDDTGLGGLLSECRTLVRVVILADFRWPVGERLIIVERRRTLGKQTKGAAKEVAAADGTTLSYESRVLSAPPSDYPAGRRPALRTC
jgi:hypothetical protein